MQGQKIAYIYASFTVLFWGTVASAFKIALRDYNIIQVLLLSNLTALVILTLAFVVRNRDLSIDLSARTIMLSALQGFLNPFLYYLVLFRAYSLLPAQVAQPVNFIWPVVLMLLSVPFLGQRLRPEGVISLLVSFGGVILLSTQGNVKEFSVAEPAGISLALASSVIWALYWILNIRDKRDNITRLFLSFLFSFIYITVTAAVSGNLKLPPGESFYASIYTGIFEMGVTFILWLKALQLSENTARVSGFVYLTPFLSLLLIHVVLDEKIYWTSVAGLFLVISGILIQQLKIKHTTVQ